MHRFLTKTLALFLCLALALPLAAGCAQTPAAPAASAAPAATPAATTAPVIPVVPKTSFPDDDIPTYTRIDPDKTLLVLSVTGNLRYGTIVDGFMAKNPDVQIVIVDITGGDSYTKPLEDWLKNGRIPDIVINGGAFSPYVCNTYLENLSANPVIARYQTQTLNQIAVDQSVYSLPGLSAVTCLIYNRTLFDQYGWELPKTFDEFVALCVQIREDTDGAVEPWNPNGKYDAEFLSSFQAFTYTEILGGVANRTWYNDFCAGEATFTGHMEPMFEAYQKVVDAGIVRPEHFTYSATTRWKEFLAGKIAIVNCDATTQFGDSPYEFGFLAFPGKTEDDVYLLTKLNSTLAVPKKEHTEAETDAIQRFLAYVGSDEGQLAYIGDTLMVSNVKGVQSRSAPQLDAIQPLVDAGHTFTYQTYTSTKGMRTKFSVYGDFRAICEGTLTAAESLAKIDAEPYVAADSSTAKTFEVVGSAAEEFTILETSNFFADMYREAANADVGLIANNIAYRGNLMRIFPGDLNTSNVTVLKPRSFENGATLVKAKMTGRQLLDAMNHPVGGDDSVANCVYAFSGLRCTVAPWNAPGERYLSVTLADGSPLDESAFYTVAFWDGTVFPEYITEIVETFPGTFEEQLTKKLAASSPIAPAKDGRITLVWD